MINKPGFWIILFMSALILSNCGSSKKATTENDVKPETMISYETDIRPLMLRSCTPCHFPEKGFKRMLHTYEDTRENIEEIMIRIQLPESDEKFMPFKEKKPSLSEEEIRVFKLWVSQGMSE
ncbi:MAG: hypothetical protein R3275_03260 [Saprospiraceae bacterium]|nr:hypothetical protein [Saprospiraceae bacterium]